MRVSECELMSDLRAECRKLNLLYRSLLLKKDRKLRNLADLESTTKSKQTRITELTSELTEDNTTTCAELSKQLESLRAELDDSRQELLELTTSVSRLNDAIEVQKAASAKRQLYGQIHAVGTKTPDAVADNLAGALRRSLEQEYDDMRTCGATTRQVLSKQAQLSRVRAIE